MSSPCRTYARRGFTLVELLIVIVIIAILALVIVPRLMGATRKAKETALRANLNLTRAAIGRFIADTGLYPLTLNDLCSITGPAKGINERGVEESLINGTFKGPYLGPEGGIIGSGVPANPFVDQNEPDVSKHWKYVADGGEVTVPDAMADFYTVDHFRYGDM